MLDKLIESRNNSEQTKTLRGFLLTTSTLVVSGVIFALIFSLFSQGLVMGQETIALSNLITPASIPNNAPTPPEQIKKSINSAEKNIKLKMPSRVTNTLRMDESPKKIPQEISTTPSNVKERPNSQFQIGLKDEDFPQASTSLQNGRDKSTTQGVGFGKDDSSEPEKIKKETPKVNKELPKPPPIEPKQEKKNVVVSRGVINGSAVRLVMPGYPSSAKSAGIRGKVTVQVMIDEEGKVISAKAIDGHVLFKQNAISAAQKSLFTPTTLSGNKVKVSGLIVYNFN